MRNPDAAAQDYALDRDRRLRDARPIFNGMGRDMAELSRRALAALAGAAAPTAALAAGQARSETPIERFELTPKDMPGIPRIAYAVARGDTVYTAGVTPFTAGGDASAPLGDVGQQTRLVLAQIDRLLAKAGTDKSKLITAQVWLTDMANFAAHNAAWNEWVDPDHPPVRACLHSPQLWKAGMLVEVMVTAAR